MIALVKATGLKNPGVSAGEVLNADRLSWEGLVDISEKLNRFDRYTKNLEAYPVIEEQLNKYREGFIVKDVVQPWLVLEYIKRNPHAYNVLFISRNIDEVIFHCNKKNWGYIKTNHLASFFSSLHFFGFGVFWT